MNTINNLFRRAYQDHAWFYAKLGYSIVCCVTLILFALPLSTALHPIGICRFINIDWLFTTHTKPILITVLIASTILYIMGIKMVLTTAMLFLISLCIVSFHESNGIYARATVLTAVTGVQFWAYLLKQVNSQFHIEKYRHQYSVQLIAAAYTLAGLSKIASSGLAWFQSPKGFSLQLVKNYYFIYSDTGNVQ